MTSKYHNKPLFDLTGGVQAACLHRLAVQEQLYRQSDPTGLWRMRVRGLYVAAGTLNATAITTAKMVQRGHLSMITQRRFFWKRWRLDPQDWGGTAKSCFARALSGVSVGQDAVCVDRHLERMGIAPKNAAEQWSEWFRLYESMYGPGEAMLCVRWHIELLDWIVGWGKRPSAWK